MNVISTILSGAFDTQAVWIEEAAQKMSASILLENKPRPLNPLDQGRLDEIHNLYVQNIVDWLVILQRLTEIGTEFKEGIQKMDLSNLSVENLQQILGFVQSKEGERLAEYEKWKQIVEVITKTQEQLIALGLQQHTFKPLTLTAPAA